MNYIVIEVCCSSCREFHNLFKVNCENFLELKHYLKDYSFYHDYSTFLIYDENCNFIDIISFGG